MIAPILINNNYVTPDRLMASTYFAWVPGYHELGYGKPVSHGIGRRAIRLQTQGQGEFRSDNGGLEALIETRPHQDPILYKSPMGKSYSCSRIDGIPSVPIRFDPRLASS
jgi:hypothetical protein